MATFGKFVFGEDEDKNKKPSQIAREDNKETSIQKEQDYQFAENNRYLPPQKFGKFSFQQENPEVVKAEKKIEDFNKLEEDIQTAEQSRNVFQKLFNWETKEEKQLKARRENIIYETINKDFTPEQKKSIIAQKPEALKNISDEEYISFRRETDKAEEFVNLMLNKNKELQKDLEEGFDYLELDATLEGKDFTHRTPYVPTREMMIQKTNIDWGKEAGKIEQFKKDHNLTSDELVNSYNRMIEAKLNQKLTEVLQSGKTESKAVESLDTGEAFTIPKVFPEDIEKEIWLQNQQLEKAKTIYEEYSGKRKVDKVDSIGEFFKTIGTDFLGNRGTAFLGDISTSEYEGFGDIMKIAGYKKKLKAGEKLTRSEQAELIFTEALETNKQINRGIVTGIANGIAPMTKMMTEMAMTAGIKNIAEFTAKQGIKSMTKKVSFDTAKELIEAEARQIALEGGETWIKAVSRKGLGGVMQDVATGIIGELPRTIAKDSLKIASEIAQEQQDPIQFSDKIEETAFFEILESNESYKSGWIDTLSKAFARQYITNILENSGGAVDDVLKTATTNQVSNKIKQKLIGKVLSDKGISTLAEFQKIYDAMGLDGMVGEVFEEYAQDYAESKLDGREFVVDDPEKFWTIVGSVGIIQFGAKAPGVAVSITDAGKSIVGGDVAQAEQQLSGTGETLPTAPGVSPSQVDTQVEQPRVQLSTEENKTIADTADLILQQSEEKGYTREGLKQLAELEAKASDPEIIAKVNKAFDTYSTNLAQVFTSRVDEDNQRLETAIKEVSQTEQKIVTQQDVVQTDEAGNTLIAVQDTARIPTTNAPSGTYWVKEGNNYRMVADAQTVDVDPNIETFVHQDPGSGEFDIVEAKTGMRIGSGTTLDRAIANANQTLEEAGGVSQFVGYIDSITESEISPRYLDVQSLPVGEVAPLTDEATTEGEKFTALTEDQKNQATEIVQKALADGMIPSANGIASRIGADQKAVQALIDEMKPKAEADTEAPQGEIKPGQKIKVGKDLREVESIEESALTPGKRIVRFKDKTYITEKRAKELAKQKTTEIAKKKEVTKQVEKAKVEVVQIAKSKKELENQEAKRRMELGKTDERVKEITKTIKDFQESEEYINVKNEYKLILKESRAGRASIQQYVDGMIELYGEEAETYLNDVLNKWADAESLVQSLEDSRRQLIDSILEQEGLLGKAGTTAKYRRQVGLERGVRLTKAEKAEIMDLNYKWFGDANVNFVEKILTNKGQRALGEYMDAWIKIAERRGDAKDTFSHEAVHKALDLFFSAKDKKKLLDAIIKLKGEDYLKNKYGKMDMVKKYRISPLFHGTPYSFEKFSTDHIGKGEGNQAYGWGLYFTSIADIGKQYAETLTGTAKHWFKVETVDGKVIESRQYGNVLKEASDRASAFKTKEMQNIGIEFVDIVTGTSYKTMHILRAEMEVGKRDENLLNTNYFQELLDERIDEAINRAEKKVAELQSQMDKITPISSSDIFKRNDYQNDIDIIKKEIKEAKNIRKGLTATGGKQFKNLYRVYLPDVSNKDLIDQDEKLTPKLKAQINDYAVFMDLKDKFGHTARELGGLMLPSEATGRDLRKQLLKEWFDSDREVSMFLKDMGFKGWKYKGDASGVTNYVIFDGDEVQIEEHMKYRGADLLGASIYDMAEEELAEMFIDYVNGQQTFTGRIKTAFKDLLDWFKSLMGMDVSEVNAFYRDLYTGKFATRDFIANSKLKLQPLYKRLSGHGELESQALEYSDVNKFIKEALYPTTIKNKDLEFRIEHVDHYEGQDYYELGVYDKEGNIKGLTKYSVYNEKAHIDFIQTVPSEMGKGIGKDMIARLQQDFESKIDLGWLTDDGAKLKGSLDNQLRTIWEEAHRTDYQGSNLGSGMATSRGIGISEMASKINKLSDNNRSNVEAISIIKLVAQKPDADITIYRATPGDVINNNDWIFITRKEAENFARTPITKTLKPGYKIIEKTVKAKDIEWTGKNLEFVYSPKGSGTPRYRAEMFVIPDLKLPPKPEVLTPKVTEKTLEKVPDLGKVYEVKGKVLLPSTKIQQEVEQTLASGQSTPITRSVTAFNPVIETTGKMRDSQAFKKILNRYEELSEIDPQKKELQYKQLSIADITAKAFAFVEQYENDARRVALGMELPPEGTTNIAVSLAYAEKMVEDGNYTKALEAERALSFRGTRFGQEIVSFRGRLNANSALHFIGQVRDMRGALTVGRTFSSGSLQKFVNEKKAKVQKLAKTLKDIKIESAEKFINELICK